MRLLQFPSCSVTCRDAAFRICNVAASCIVQDCPDIPVTTGIVSTHPVGNSDTSKRRLKHAIAVSRGSLQTPQRPKACGVSTSQVLTPLSAAGDLFTPHPRAVPIFANVTEVALNSLVLGMHPRCNPYLAVKGSLLWIRRMKMLPRCLYFVALQVRVAWARETIFARLLERKKVIPFFWLDCNCMLYPTPFCHILSTYSIEIWWCLIPCPLTNWSQIPTLLNSIGICVENCRICVFLQRAKPRHGLAAPCPRRATISYPQRCNCLDAFLLRSDVKAVRAIRPEIGKPLILWGAIIGCVQECWLAEAEHDSHSKAGASSER